MLGHLPGAVAVGIIDDSVGPQKTRSPSHTAQFSFGGRSRSKGRRERLDRLVSSPIHGLDHRIKLFASDPRGRRPMAHVLKKRGNRNPPHRIEIDHQ